MKSRLAASALIATLLSACGGGGGAKMLPTTPTSPLTPTAVTFALKVPTKAHQVVGHVKVHGHDYVSPATLGVGVNYASGSASFTSSQLATPNLTFDLSTCGSNCTVNSDGSHTYAISGQIPPGTYTFEITTWDSAPVSGSFTGNELSQSTIANQAIVAGSVSTTINFTLNGIPSALSFSAVPSQSHIEENTNGYGIVGNAPVYFIGNAIDADGYIITGSGAPTLTLTDSSGSFAISNNGNVFSVNALSANSASVSATFAATPPSGSGLSALSENINLSPIPELWVAQSGGSANGLFGFALDGANYAPAYNVLDSMTNASYSLLTVAADTSGNLWAVNNSVNLQEFTAATGSTPPVPGSSSFGLPGGASSAPQGMAIDANDILWVADTPYPSLQQYGEVVGYDLTNTSAPKYALTASAAGGGFTGVTDVAIAPSTTAIPSALRGSIWTASGLGIDILTVSGGTLSDTYPSVLATGITSLAIGSDATVWTYDGSNINAYALTMSGSTPVLTFEAQTSAVGGMQLAVDPGGTVWSVNGIDAGAGSYTLSGCPSACVVNLGSNSVYPGSATSNGVYVAP